MRQIKNLGDKRQTQHCLYCGGRTETREHIPPKVFLDSPYPENLPVVSACRACNEGYSLDEEYAACLIECAITGSAKNVQREKIKRILSKKGALRSRIENARVESGEFAGFKVEDERFSRVANKLAEGHLLFEQNEPGFSHSEPLNCRYGILADLTEEERQEFEQASHLDLLPEVGSRALQRMVFDGERISVPWIEVQRGVYRYLVPSVGVVRIVLGEHVWVEVERQD